MSAELASTLVPRLAVNDAGHGGDGRRLSPRDNGGPGFIDTKKMGRPFAAVGVLGVLPALGGFWIDRSEILQHLKENDFTLEQFLDALRDALS